MSFLDVFHQFDWDDVRLSLYSKTSADVVRALRKTKRSLEDFKALISPAAEPFLEQMARQSMALTRKRFGNTVGFYIPLYLSNLCSNSCTYCGFSMENRLKRKILNHQDIETEIAAIKQMKYDNILLVTGEHETKVGLSYFEQVVPLIKRHFNYVAMEVQPLDESAYVRLKALGLDGVMVYQETYHPSTYAQHHLRGNKTDFEYRLLTPDRLGKAGIDKIGLGALIGLDDWRTDIFHVALHLAYLEKTYWQSRYSISFPRLRPCAGGVEPVSVMTDRQLVQTICAFRLFDPEVELSLSTRESPNFRDNVVPLGITAISAGSKTQPGGYADHTSALEQFSVSDDRSVEEVVQAVIHRGLEPIWHDWHAVFSG
ncbi:2-iminoacetate synthase ThiH [Vibrio rhizosphaerae]|uniref:2-iminoacetate synthase ThiH n=1 Tax=Vibrio rhizosphaerae TaxID=398736 RepID=A0ABU4IRN3_9VIBR|nr:2-iminoacetate synthase ThiH [Vibrio rhizosphaerae]MDW6091371.1 2-iminoacetate synthase ThiH [Vibrio rhizosphaerae]